MCPAQQLFHECLFTVVCVQARLHVIEPRHLSEFSKTRRTRNTRPEHPDAQVECDICHRKFTRTTVMYRHKRTVHGVGDVKTFPCDMCGKVFRERIVLKVHMSSVHSVGDVRRYPCSHCPKVCTQKGNLMTHMKNRHSKQLQETKT